MERVQRRDFFIAAVALLAAPSAVSSQPTRKVHRIGYLGSGSSTSGYQDA
jgi:hypothetical protein